MKRLMFAGLLFAFALLVVQPASADTAYQVGMNGSGSLMATLSVGEGAITVVAGDSGVTISGGNPNHFVWGYLPSATRFSTVSPGTLTTSVET